MAAEYTKWKGPEPRPYYAKYKKLTVRTTAAAGSNAMSSPETSLPSANRSICRR